MRLLIIGRNVLLFFPTIDCLLDVAQEDWITEADMREIRLEELRDREFYVPLTEGEIVEECDDEPA